MNPVCFSVRFCHLQFPQNCSLVRGRTSGSMTFPYRLIPPGEAAGATRCMRCMRAATVGISLVLAIDCWNARTLVFYRSIPRCTRFLYVLFRYRCPLYGHAKCCELCLIAMMPATTLRRETPAIACSHLSIAHVCIRFSAYRAV